MTDAYTALAEYYDRLTGDVDYDKWADYIERHFRRLKRPVRSVAELACGTGTLAVLLARRGYRVTAMDLSPEMLSVAAGKREGLDVTLVCQDMSRLRLPQPADAVICCLDSVNYVTRPAALGRTFRRVYESLSPGGLFLFDAKTPLALESADGQLCLDESDGLLCVWRGEYSPKRRICGYGIDLFTLRPDGAWDRASEYHEEYAYTPGELERDLLDAGFPSVQIYGDKTMRPPKEGAERVFLAAVKGPPPSGEKP